MLSPLERTKVYTRVGDDTDVEEKLAPTANDKEQKDKLTMDSIIETS